MDDLSLMMRNITEQRLQEICTIFPELLEQKENVVLFEQETPGNPWETRYLITLDGDEVAKFSVQIKMDNMAFKVSVSDVQYSSRK